MRGEQSKVLNHTFTDLVRIAKERNIQGFYAPGEMLPDALVEMWKGNIAGADNKDGRLWITVGD